VTLFSRREAGDGYQSWAKLLSFLNDPGHS